MHLKHADFMFQKKKIPLLSGNEETNTVCTCIRSSIVGKHVTTNPRDCDAISAEFQVAIAVIQCYWQDESIPSKYQPQLERRRTPGSASNMNTTLSPTAMQTLQQVALDGVSVSDVHGLGATSQHAGNPNNNRLVRNLSCGFSVSYKLIFSYPSRLVST